MINNFKEREREKLNKYYIISFGSDDLSKTNTNKTLMI